MKFRRRIMYFSDMISAGRKSKSAKARVAGRWEAVGCARQPAKRVCKAGVRGGCARREFKAGVRGNKNAARPPLGDLAATAFERFASVPRAHLPRRCKHRKGRMYRACERCGHRDSCLGGRGHRGTTRRVPTAFAALNSLPGGPQVHLGIRRGPNDGPVRPRRNRTGRGYFLAAFFLAAFFLVAFFFAAFLAMETPRTLSEKRKSLHRFARHTAG